MEEQILKLRSLGFSKKEILENLVEDGVDETIAKKEIDEALSNIPKEKKKSFNKMSILFLYPFSCGIILAFAFLFLAYRQLSYTLALVGIVLVILDVLLLLGKQIAVKLWIAIFSLTSLFNVVMIFDGCRKTVIGGPLWQMILVIFLLVIYIVAVFKTVYLLKMLKEFEYYDE